MYVMSQIISVALSNFFFFCSDIVSVSCYIHYKLPHLDSAVRSDNGAECRALTQKSLAEAKAAVNLSPVNGPPTLS